MTNQEERQHEGAHTQTFYASSVGLAATGTDIKVAFGDSLPIVGADGVIQEERQHIHRALVAMSFHTAKDLHSVLGTALAQLEQSFGAIDTPFLQQRQQAKQPD